MNPCEFLELRKEKNQRENTETTSILWVLALLWPRNGEFMLEPAKIPINFWEFVGAGPFREDEWGSWPQNEHLFTFSCFVWVLV